MGIRRKNLANWFYMDFIISILEAMSYLKMIFEDFGLFSATNNIINSEA